MGHIKTKEKAPAVLEAPDIKDVHAGNQNFFIDPTFVQNNEVCSDMTASSNKQISIDSGPLLETLRLYTSENQSFQKGLYSNENQPNSLSLPFEDKPEFFKYT